jgi:hypothetical protein
VGTPARRVESALPFADPADEEGLRGNDPSDFEPGKGNVDVEVELADGSLWSATFFTLANIKALFEKNHRTGECGGGLLGATWSSASSSRATERHSATRG